MIFPARPLENPFSKYAEQDIKCGSPYCVNCAVGPDGKIVGTVNESFNNPGAYTCE